MRTPQLTLKELIKRLVGISEPLDPQVAKVRVIKRSRLGGSMEWFREVPVHYVYATDGTIIIDEDDLNEAPKRDL